MAPETQRSRRGVAVDDFGFPQAGPAYESTRAAAELIGVSPSTLTRRSDVERVEAGNEWRIPTTEVIRLAAQYQKRSVSLIAGELVARAAQYGPEVQAAVGQEVDAALEFYSPRRARTSDAEDLLAGARRLLPARLADQVERALEGRQEDEEMQGGAGWRPDDDD